MSLENADLDLLDSTAKSSLRSKSSNTEKREKSSSNKNEKFDNDEKRDESHQNELMVPTSSNLSVRSRSRSPSSSHKSGGENSTNKHTGDNLENCPLRSTRQLKNLAPKSASTPPSLKESQNLLEANITTKSKATSPKPSSTHLSPYKTRTSSTSPLRSSKSKEVLASENTVKLKSAHEHSTASNKSSKKAKEGAAAFIHSSSKLYAHSERASETSILKLSSRTSKQSTPSSPKQEPVPYKSLKEKKISTAINKYPYEPKKSSPKDQVDKRNTYITPRPIAPVPFSKPGDNERTVISKPVFVSEISKVDCPSEGTKKTDKISNKRSTRKTSAPKIKPQNISQTSSFLQIPISDSSQSLIDNYSAQEPSKYPSQESPRKKLGSSDLSIPAPSPSSTPIKESKSNKRRNTDRISDTTKKQAKPTKVSKTDVIQAESIISASATNVSTSSVNAPPKSSPLPPIAPAGYNQGKKPPRAILPHGAPLILPRPYSFTSAQRPAIKYQEILPAGYPRTADRMTTAPITVISSQPPVCSKPTPSTLPNTRFGPASGYFQDSSKNPSSSSTSNCKVSSSNPHQNFSSKPSSTPRHVTTTLGPEFSSEVELSGQRPSTSSSNPRTYPSTSIKSKSTVPLNPAIKHDTGLPHSRDLKRTGPKRSYRSVQARSIGGILEIRIPSYYLQLGWEHPKIENQFLWGTDIYTDDSDIVAVLVHLGYIQLPREDDGSKAEKPKLNLKMIKFDENKVSTKDQENKDIEEKEKAESLEMDFYVTIQIRPLLHQYIGSLRNGYRSRNWDHSHDGVSYSVVEVLSKEKGGSFQSGRKNRKLAIDAFNKLRMAVMYGYP